MTESFQNPLKFLFVIIHLLLISSCSSKSWRDASRESVGIAPKAQDLTEDIVLIYYARAFSWRGYFGVHPWVSYKRKEDQQYTVTQVTAWNLRGANTAISYQKDLPDRKWFDSYPTLLFEARGAKARKIIDQIEELIKTYPFKDRYTVYPGPNSNTFVSYLMRNIDEIDAELPPTAIGKDYLGTNSFLSNTPSNTGLIFNAYGFFGITLGLKEGIEFNLFGLNFGFDLFYPALKLPFIGRVGFP